MDITVIFTSPNGASVEYADVTDPAPIKVLRDGIDITNTVTLNFTGYYTFDNEFGNKMYTGTMGIIGWPQGDTQLTFRYGDQNLIGKDAFGGSELSVSIPNQSSPFTTNPLQVFFDTDEIFGCTDPGATNYDPSANFDDGSCEYASLEDKIVISEVHYNPNDEEQPDIDGEIPDDDTDTSWEFFEIHNPTDEILSVAGLGISFYGSDEYKRNGDLWPDGLPPAAVLRPNGRIVFANTAATYDGTCYCVTEVEEQNRDYTWTLNPTCDETTCPPDSEFRSFEHLIAYDGTNVGTANLYEWQSGNARKLGNASTSGYNITIRDASPTDGPNNTTGNVIDTIKYHNGTHDDDNSCTHDWPDQVSTYGRSIVLHHSSLDNNCGKNWWRSGVRGGSPGLPNSLSWNSDTWKTLVGGHIAITEVYIDPPAGLEASHEFIQIANWSPTPVSMEGWIDMSSTGYRPINITDGATYGGMPAYTLGSYSYVLLVKKTALGDPYDTYTCQTMWTYEGFIGNPGQDAGEVLSIRDMFGTLVDQLDMNQFDSEWDAAELALNYPFASTQGLGSTVQLKTWNNDCYADNNNPACWQASVFEHGDPCQMSTQPNFGCMDDPDACNYDSSVNVDDGSCEPQKLCCPDTNNNGLCDNVPTNGYSITCNDCPPNTLQWFSDEDPGYDIYGCTTVTNCNYNADATFHDESQCLTLDCNEDCGGTAELNVCGECIYGNTGITDDTNGMDGFYGQDCNGDCAPDDCSDNNVFGCAVIDECGDCVGGNTQFTILDPGENPSHSDYPTNYYVLFDVDENKYDLYVANNQDCTGECGGDTVVDDCSICDGNNFGSGNQQDCNGDCFGTAQDLGCGCGESGPVDYYLDQDGDGIGGEAEGFCPGEVPNNYVSTPGDNNDFCDNDSTIGDYYDGNSFGQDDCGRCERLATGTYDANFNYFSPTLETSKDCGDGINENTGLCPGEEGFNNPPGTHRADTNGDGIDNECFQTLVWYTGNNNFDFGTVINHGCNFTNACKGTNDVWGPGVLMGYDGEFIDISGQTAKGCRDTNALNYQVRHYFDCAGNPLGSNYAGCCHYPLDCNEVEGGSAALDDCGVCSEGNTNHVANSDKDCYGTCPNNLPASSECPDDYGWNQANGSCQPFGSFFDDCDVCVGGGTGFTENQDMDCIGDCFGEAVSNADGNGNCCLLSQVQTYYQDADGDGLGNPDLSDTYCSTEVPDGWVLNNTDDLGDDFYCPATCDENGQNQSSGQDNVCLVDCLGVCGGIFEIDSCGNCNNPDTPTDVDCNGVCDGEDGYGAYIDDCGNCVGGSTSSSQNGCFDEVDILGYSAAESLFNTGGTNAYEGVCPPNWAMDCSSTCNGESSNDCADACGGSSLEDECGECYNPGNGESPPNQCVGCTDSTACNYDISFTIDDGSCLWFNCLNQCVCEADNQSHSSCVTLVDQCGECGGDNDCEGCTDPTAINYDPFATQNFNNACIYGDITITPSSTNGMGQDFILIQPVGNDNQGQNTNINTADYNSNYGGWKFQNSDEVVQRYSLIVDRKTNRTQTEPVSPYTIDTFVEENIDGTIIDGGYNGEQLCNWFTNNPNGNPDTGMGANSFESLINCGYGKTLERDGTYFVTITIEGSLGTTATVSKQFDVSGIFRINQTLKFNSNDQMYIPQQGINIAKNDTTGSFSNTKQWYEKNNKFDRFPLGCFYYDEDQFDEWETFGSSYKYLQRHLELQFVPNYLNGYCSENTEGVQNDDGEIPEGYCVGGVRDGMGCPFNNESDNGNDSCISTINTSVFDAGLFTPDVVGTSKQAQYLEFDYMTPLADRKKGVLHEYYSTETDEKNYDALKAPKNMVFLFTPRAFDEDMSDLDISWGKQVFNQRNRISMAEEDSTYDYFIGFIDWGDETTLTEQEFDYNSEPFKLGFDSTITHRYSRPGIYEIKGYMFSVYKNEACRFRCEIPEIDELGGEDTLPDWWENNQSRYIFNVSKEFCDRAGGTYTINVDGNCGIMDKKKFTYRINIPSAEDEEVFIPYNENEPVIGGVSKSSIYYRTIERELGYLATGGKIDLEFKFVQDKLNTEHAFIKMNDDAIEDTSVLKIYNQSIFSGSVDFNGELLPSSSTSPHPAVIVSGSYDEGYGELSAGNYFGNADLNQVRFFSDGNLTMDKMLGFINIIPDMSYTLFEGEGSVLITAPHSPITLRPTAPGYDGPLPAWPHMPDDYTGAMAYQIGKLTNSHVLISNYMQDDANYYHHIGRDYYGRTSETATPAFVGMEGQLHPFKKKLKEYLTQHPEIKLVIDLHGAGDYRTFSADIGVAYPFKNRQEEADYQSGYVDYGWYPDNDEDLNLYSMIDYNYDEDFPGPASPELNRFWNGDLSSLWDTFTDMDTYAPSMVTDLGKGLSSPQNPNGDSLLKKLIEILEQNNIGDGDGYRDRYYSGLYEYDSEGSIAHYYFRGEWLEQRGHACPDKQSNTYNLANYINDCDLSIYEDCQEAWELFLDGTYYCAQPGVKKPITIGRDFTAGAQNTITRFVALDALESDSYFSDDESAGQPASFVGNVDAFQLELSRNHREFDPNDPVDLRTYKAMVEFISFVNNHYGYQSTVPDFNSDEFKNSYNETYDFYHNNLKPQGEILLDETIALQQHPNNPSSKRYWKNIIPDYYGLGWRDGFYDYSTQLNKRLYRGGESELTILPVETVLNSNLTLKICNKGEIIGGESITGDTNCELLYSDILFNKYSNQNNNGAPVVPIYSKPNAVISNNIVYWNLENVEIGTETFNEIFDGFNNVEKITWIKNGRPVNSTYFDGTWSGDLYILEKGRYYMFEMYSSVDLQRENLDSKLSITTLIHNKNIDVDSNQQWLTQITNATFTNDDNGCEYDDLGEQITGCQSNRGELIYFDESIPYYPVLPKLDLFGKFSSDDNLQKSIIDFTLPENGEIIPNQDLEYATESGTCICDDTGLVSDSACNLGYEPQCSFITEGEYGCNCYITPASEVDPESGDSNDPNFDITNMYIRIENNIPFGSPGRLWYDYDRNSPVSNTEYTNLNNIEKASAVDINFDELDENRLYNNSGVEAFNYVFGDYKINFDDDTRNPSKGDFENLPQIRKDGREAY